MKSIEIESQTKYHFHKYSYKRELRHKVDQAPCFPSTITTRPSTTRLACSYVRTPTLQPVQTLWFAIDRRSTQARTLRLACSYVRTPTLQPVQTLWFAIDRRSTQARTLRLACSYVRTPTLQTEHALWFAIYIISLDGKLKRPKGPYKNLKYYTPPRLKPRGFFIPPSQSPSAKQMGFVHLGDQYGLQ